MQDPTDVELIERAQAGDTTAYGELVRRYQARAYRVAFIVTRSAADAEEATQDGFVRAWNALSRFRVGEPFGPWIMHIVRNQARNAVRSRSRRDAMQQRLEIQPQIQAADTAATVATRDAQQQLLAAVDRLPERLREVVSCLYLLELSETETATVLGIPRGTVKSRAARARERLSREVPE